MISFLDNESTVSDGVSFLWTNRSRNPCGSFYYAFSFCAVLFGALWLLGVVPFHYMAEHSEVLSVLQTCTLLHERDLRYGEKKKKSLWLLFYSPIPHHLAAFSWMAGLRAGPVRVFSISLKYLQFTVSAVVQVLPKTHFWVLTWNWILWVEYVAKLLGIVRTVILFKQLKGILGVIKVGKQKWICPQIQSFRK